MAQHFQPVIVSRSDDTDLGIAIDAIWQVMLRDKLQARPIDREHLVERMGLLAIIILGESVIAMVASLDHEHWNGYDMASASIGFLLIGAIWWVYFDSYVTAWIEIVYRQCW